MLYTTRLSSSAAALLLAAQLGCRGVTADDEGSGAARRYFEGATLTYIVATEAGGGYDTYARLLARHLAPHLGVERIVVKNVPGGGHVRGARELASARPDGLTIGTFNTGLIYAQALSREAPAVDLRALSWVGKAGVEPRVLVASARAGFRSAEDLRRASRPLLVATSGAGSAGHVEAMVLAHALGLRVKPVFGLASHDAQLSMMRGEVDLEVASWSVARSFVENGHGHPVLRIGTADGLAATVPEAGQLVSTDDGRALLDIVRAQGDLFRWTAAPPGVPPDRLVHLRAAYVAALNEPGLRDEAERLGLPVRPMHGDALSAEVSRVVALAARHADLLRGVLDAPGR